MDAKDTPLLDAEGTPYGERIETHISVVFLGEHEVVKRKKAVRFPFLDFSTEELRLAACEEELRLNRRLSPDVYLDVVPLRRRSDGTLQVHGEGELVDHAVRMRRLDDAERADVRLAQGSLHAALVEAFASRLVRFHAEAAIDRDAQGPGSIDTLRAHVRENLDALVTLGRDHLGADGATALADAHLAALSELGPLLDRRREAGRVRDGHGDLRLEHVYFADDGTLRVLDCVEFDRAFRVADVAADVAFFAMDLHANGRADLAERFIARYVRDAADHELYRVVDFFAAYFAMVRAKVSAARAAQATGDDAVACLERARAMLDLARRFVRRPSHPIALLAFGGPIASGKSTLAREVGTHFGIPVIESDRLRKQLYGVDPEARLDEPRAYGPEATERVYRELLERAGHVLASGRSVVLDATYRSRAHRRAVAAFSEQAGVGHRLVLCTAPREVLAARLRAREGSASVSDARIDLLDSFLAGFEPLADDERATAIEVDTSGELAMVEGAVFERVAPSVGRADPDATDPAGLHPPGILR